MYAPSSPVLSPAILLAAPRGEAPPSEKCLREKPVEMGQELLASGRMRFAQERVAQFHR